MKKITSQRDENEKMREKKKRVVKIMEDSLFYERKGPPSEVHGQRKLV